MVRGGGKSEGAERNDRLAARLRALADRLTGHAPPPDALEALEALTARLESTLAREAAAEAGASQLTFPGAPLSPDAPIRIWSDGSCAPNPGPGGWGAILEQGGQREEMSGASHQSTNNIMEMTAAIEALKRTPPGAEIHLTTDSRYLKDGITRWLPGWKRKGWRKADGDPVLNRELWEELDRLIARRRVAWSWVPAHSGHPENERCDQLANQARKNL